MDNDPTSLSKFDWLIFTAWALFVVVLCLFAPGGGDEGGYHHQAVQIAEGRIPVIDFFTMHGIWTYLPFSIIAKLFSPSIEAMRIFSGISIIAGVWMITAYIRRYYGREHARYAFIFMAFSWPWLTNNLEVRHSVAVNLGLIVAFVCLYYFRTFSNWRYFFVGFALGVSVNARFVLAPLIIPFVYLIYKKAKAEGETRIVGAQIISFVAGGLLASIFSIYLLIVDTDGFFYNYLLARLDLTRLQDERPQGLVSLIIWAIQTRIVGLAEFFWGINRNGLWQNLIVISPLVIITVLVFIKADAGKFKTLKRLFSREGVMPALWLSLGVIFSYSLADRFHGVYLHHIIPFLIIAGLGVLAQFDNQIADSVMSGASRRRRHYVKIGFCCLFIPYVLWFLAWGSADIIRRAEPSIARPMTISTAACWLEANTPPDTIIMSYLGSPVASVGNGRRLPSGYEQGQGMLEMFMLNPNKERVREHGILTDEDFLDQVREGKIPVIVHDNMIEKYEVLSARIDEIKSDYYVEVDTTGGRFAYTMFVDRRSEISADYTIVSQSRLNLTSAKVKAYIKNGEWESLARETLTDIRVSLSRLPADVGRAYASALGLDYEVRCSTLVQPK